MNSFSEEAEGEKENGEKAGHPDPEGDLEEVDFFCRDAEDRGGFAEAVVVVDGAEANHPEAILHEFPKAGGGRVAFDLDLGIFPGDPLLFGATIFSTADVSALYYESLRIWRGEFP